MNSIHLKFYNAENKYILENFYPANLSTIIQLFILSDQIK